LQQADNKYFEEYKQPDKLCSEMYSCKNGVSEYIAQMENKSYQAQYRVSSWDSDYNMLKHIRWVRNRIAHDSGTHQISNPEDLEFVRDFYNRIFSGQDSLTILRKAIDAEDERRKQQKKQQTSQVSAPTPAYSYTPPKKASRILLNRASSPVYKELRQLGRRSFPCTLSALPFMPSELRQHRTISTSAFGGSFELKCVVFS